MIIEGRYTKGWAQCCSCSCWTHVVPNPYGSDHVVKMRERIKYSNLSFEKCSKLCMWISVLSGLTFAYGIVHFLVNTFYALHFLMLLWWEKGTTESSACVGFYVSEDMCLWMGSSVLVQLDNKTCGKCGRTGCVWENFEAKFDDARKT